ncbi:caspase family protein [Thermoflexibacter ruber]|uniref:Caspase domain-containing protein n=1 Tax=Thermoflexibacter ruber TaxID=1003 RepID=A0A1I2C1E2_9BACT|nr:caspase family protein [Thermoflexibacter ruber]SFE62094.1 Caspase domain-containing protein [Thermoflexibacter ruber]
MKKFVFIFLPMLLANWAFAQQNLSTGGENEKRLAFIIGNAKYDAPNALHNSVNDARKMKENLMNLGFKVVYLEDGDLNAIQKSFREFKNELKDYNVRLFYYSGHGLQVKNINYLVPIKANLEEMATDETAIEYGCFKVNDILAAMNEKQGNVNIIILDACRDNPVEKVAVATKGLSKSVATTQGLAPVTTSEGTVILYATSAGRKASDGEGDNGLFTSELIKQMNKPRIRIEDVFKEVGKEVSLKSKGKQRPEFSGTFYGDFFFKPEKYMTPAEKEAERLEKEKKEKEEQAKIEEARKKALEEARKANQEELAQIQAQKDKEKAELEKKMKEELALEKEKFEREKKKFEEERAREQERIKAEIEKLKQAEKEKLAEIERRENEIKAQLEKEKAEALKEANRKQKELEETQRQAKAIEEKLLAEKKALEANRQKADEAQLKAQQRVVDSMAQAAERLRFLQNEFAQLRQKQVADSLARIEREAKMQKELEEARQNISSTTNNQIDQLDAEQQAKEEEYNRRIQSFASEIANKELQLAAKEREVAEQKRVIDSLRAANAALVDAKKVKELNLTEEEKIDINKENEWKDFGKYRNFFEMDGHRFGYSIDRNNEFSYNIDVTREVFQDDINESVHVYVSRISIDDMSDKNISMKLLYSEYRDNHYMNYGWVTTASSYVEAKFDLENKIVKFTPVSKIGMLRNQGQDFINELALENSQLSIRNAIVITIKYFMRHYTRATKYSR